MPEELVAEDYDLFPALMLNLGSQNFKDGSKVETIVTGRGMTEDMD
jgi:hypothetical protein